MCLHLVHFHSPKKSPAEERRVKKRKRERGREKKKKKRAERMGGVKWLSERRGRACGECFCPGEK